MQAAKCLSNLPQPHSGRNLRSANTTYQNLRQWDVIEVYHGNHLKPCVVLAKQNKDNTTMLKIHPYDRRDSLNPNNIKSARFVASTPVTVLFNARSGSYEDQKQLVLSVLEPGREPKTAREIQDALGAQGRRVQTELIRKTCNDLVLSGQLIERYTSTKRWRLPLPQSPGIIVLELFGTRSEKLGWVTRWQEHRQCGEVRPVVQFIDGTTGMSVDTMLEPTECAPYCQWVKQLWTGDLPIPPTPLFTGLIRDLDCRQTNLKSPPVAALLAVAKELGLVDGWKRSFPSGAEGKAVQEDCLNYLNAFYPGWSYGVDVRLCWQDRIDELLVMGGAQS